MNRKFQETTINKAMKKASLAETSEANISTSDNVKTSNRGVTDYE